MLRLKAKVKPAKHVLSRQSLMRKLRGKIQIKNIPLSSWLCLFSFFFGFARISSTFCAFISAHYHNFWIFDHQSSKWFGYYQCCRDCAYNWLKFALNKIIFGINFVFRSVSWRDTHCISPWFRMSSEKNFIFMLIVNKWATNFIQSHRR